MKLNKTENTYHIDDTYEHTEYSTKTMNDEKYQLSEIVLFFILCVIFYTSLFLYSYFFT